MYSWFRIFSWPALEISFLRSGETHSETLDHGSGCTYNKSQLANLTLNGEGRALAWARANATENKPFNLWWVE